MAAFEDFGVNDEVRFTGDRSLYVTSFQSILKRQGVVLAVGGEGRFARLIWVKLVPKTKRGKPERCSFRPEDLEIVKKGGS